MKQPRPPSIIVTIERTGGHRVQLGVGLTEAAAHPERFRRIRVDRHRLPPELAANPYFDPGHEPVVRDR
ncbi:hypothetical protein HY634_01470 [Candidatus Uhrbacteria bacterium]|nr:hypothetical protein [Candidatus Uhrbacteria bacterium]